MSAGHVTSPPLNSEEEQGTIKQSCLAITKLYRAGTVSETFAILQLQEALPGVEGIYKEQTTFISSLKSYVTILDSFDCMQRGALTQGGFGGEEGNTEVEGETRQQGLRYKLDDNNVLIAPGANKCARSISSDGGMWTFSKCKVDINCLPWAIHKNLAPPSLSYSICQTQSILKNISRDPKLVKADLYNRPGLPQFPGSEWMHILARQAVDLDHVLSGIYGIPHNDRHTEKLTNSLYFIFGRVKPSKTVQSHGQWVIAWSATVKATRIVFPH